MGLKISSFMVALLMVGVFVGGFAIFLNEGAINYGIEGYDNSSMNRYDKLEELNDQAEELRNASVSITTESGITDVIGSYFKSAYSALSLAQKSFGTSVDIVQEGASSAKIGTYRQLITVGIIGALTVLFFVGILLSRILKVDT